MNAPDAAAYMDLALQPVAAGEEDSLELLNRDDAIAAPSARVA